MAFEHDVLPHVLPVGDQAVQQGVHVHAHGGLVAGAAAGELGAVGHDAAQDVDVAQQLGPQGGGGVHALHAQADAGQGGAQVVGHGGQDAFVLAHTGADAFLHLVEGPGGLAHFGGPVFGQGRGVEVAAKALGLAGEHPQGPHHAMHHHEDEQDQQARFQQQHGQGCLAGGEVIGIAADDHAQPFAVVQAHAHPAFVHMGPGHMTAQGGVHAVGHMHALDLGQHLAGIQIGLDAVQVLAQAVAQVQGAFVLRLPGRIGDIAQAQMDHVQPLQPFQQGALVLEGLGMQELQGKGQAVGLLQQGGPGRLPLLHPLDRDSGHAVQQKDAADEHARQLCGKRGGRQAAQQTGKKGRHAATSRA